MEDEDAKKSLSLFQMAGSHAKIYPDPVNGSYMRVDRKALVPTHRGLSVHPPPHRSGAPGAALNESDVRYSE